LNRTADDRNEIKEWNAQHYDDKMGYVSQLGIGLIDILEPMPDERILEVGCGTGDLMAEIAKCGAICHGIDSSPEMIQEAVRKFPRLKFEVRDARTFQTEEPFDAVFSNSALHWIQPPEVVVQMMSAVLKPAGRLVVEFGGEGNIAKIVQAIEETLQTYGIDGAKRNPWYFPSIGTYTSLLEQCGFHVIYAKHVDRPTKLADFDQGLYYFLDAFAGLFFVGLTEEQKNSAYQTIANHLRSDLFLDGVWIADYKRIRVYAIKK